MCNGRHAPRSLTLERPKDPGAKSGRIAYSLDVAKLKQNMNEAPMAFSNVLDYIGRQPGGLSFLGLWAAAEKAIEVSMKTSGEPPWIRSNMYRLA